VIVHISSDAAVEAYPAWGGYGASKAALEHMSRTWAAELAGVRVLSVDPGEMDTAMHAAAIPDADRSALADPRVVARRTAAMIADPARAPSGARLAAASWLPAPAAHGDVDDANRDADDDPNRDIDGDPNRDAGRDAAGEARS
jgi:NAD(P)-dependent dehydrogenase (short-subunit alcohol dehydrogenase family)